MRRMTPLLAKLTRPRIVNSHPFPIPPMMGAVTTHPMQEKIFRTKLFRATPSDDFFGMNSVSIVVTILKMSMEPMPKKKFAIIYRAEVSGMCGFSKHDDIPEQAKILPFLRPIRTRSVPPDTGRRRAKRSRAFGPRDRRSICLSRHTDSLSSLLVA